MTEENTPTQITKESIEAAAAEAEEVTNETEEVTNETEELPDLPDPTAGYDGDLDDGYELIDYNDIPEAIRGKYVSRINRFYKEMKERDSQFQTIAGDYQKVEEENQRLAKRLAELESNYSTNEYNTRLNQLEVEIEQAEDAGDTAEVRRLMREQMRIELQKDQAGNVEEPETEEKPQPTYSDPTQQAVIETIGEDGFKEIQRWSSMRDMDGNLKHPWMQPGHPLAQHVATFAHQIYNDPANAGKPMTEILQLVENKVKPYMSRQVNKNEQRSAAVLSGTGGEAPKGDIELTPEQKMVALKLYRNLPQKEALERYKKSLERTRG